MSLKKIRKTRLEKNMDKLRQSKEFQRPVFTPVPFSEPKITEIIYDNDFIGKLHLLRKKYPNDASFGAEVDKLLKDGNNI